jgi:hypothetical protein
VLRSIESREVAICVKCWSYSDGVNTWSVEQSQRAAEVKVEVGEQRELLLSAACCCLQLLSS